MQKERKKYTPLSVTMVVLTYISFALGYWYGARSTVATISSYAIISNEITAALIGGVLPFVIFEAAVRFYVRPLQRVILTSLDKPVFRLRLYFMLANIISFALSFIYFAYPFLSVWGGILLNFVVSFVCVTVYLILESRKFEDKSKIAYFIMQIGIIFLFIHGVMALLGAFFG